MQQQVTSSCAWLRGVTRMFASQGVDLPAVFEAAGVDIARLKQGHTRFTFDEVNRIWAQAVAASGNPALGVDQHLVARYVNFDISAHAMWPGPTLLDGLRGLARYLNLIGDSSSFTIKPTLEGAWVELDNGSDRKMPRARVEFGVLVLVTLCRRVTRSALKPLAFETVFPEPADLHPHLMAFACPLRFGQPVTRLLLRQADLDRPLAASGAALSALHERVNEERLARLGKARLRWRTGSELVHRLHLGEPAMRDVARALGMTEAALKRGLAAENSDYPRLLDEVRHDLAVRYLAEPGFPLTRVPELLGLESPQALAAACKRWFGMSPSQYRILHEGDGVQP